MSMPPFCRLLLPALCASLIVISCAASRAAAAAAAADRVVYQRAGTLFLLEDGRATPLAALGRVSAAGALWAVAPDGGRVAWAASPGAAAGGLPPLRGQLNDEGEGAVSPPGETPTGGSGIVLYVAELAGRRQRGASPPPPPKRLLATDALKDRQGRRVTALSGAGGGAAALSAWEPVSLGWSADGRTLYLGLASGKGKTAVAATVAADAATGAPLVDAAGRWKALAPLAHADAHGLTLAGIGSGGGALVVVNLPEARRVAIAPEGVAHLRDPALSPDGARIAFAAFPAGLYLVGADGKQAAGRFITGEVARPRWSRDGKRLYFLSPRPSVGGAAGPALYDLFVVTAPAAGGGAPPDAPRRLRENVEAFDIAGGAGE